MAGGGGGGRKAAYSGVGAAYSGVVAAYSCVWAILRQRENSVGGGGQHWGNRRGCVGVWGLTLPEVTVEGCSYPTLYFSMRLMLY